MNKSVSKKSLKAHSWLGVFTGFLLFLVCLSGTLAVVHKEFERWEQPAIEEMSSISVDAVQRAYETFTRQHTEPTDHYHIVFPTSGIPRFVVENDDVAYFATPNGDLLTTEASPWTSLLVDLHLYLHLPSSWGMILVSALGAIICALVFSGILAHKRIAKDAFKLRHGGNGQQANIDLHNRFGVWAAPFHLIIGVTGAYFGLAGLLLVLVSQLFYDGDRQAVIDKVFTPEPVLEAEVMPVNVGIAYAQSLEMAPDGKPVFLTVHEPNTPAQFIEIYTYLPDRLIYSENYRFDAEGNFLGTAGYQDGLWGKQLVYSLYRLHFGEFAGWAGKGLYLVLGMMLTLLCTSGMNIWFSKRGDTHSKLYRVWHGLVWATPIALALTAMVALFTQQAPAWLFWLIIVASLMASILITKLNKVIWRRLTGVSLLLLLFCYVIVHQEYSTTLAALQLNIPILIIALWLLRPWKRDSVS